MSVLLESQPGDAIVCVQEFHASPDGQPFAWDTSRHFRIGERVHFVSGRLNPRFADRPNAWLVVFETAAGSRYAAVQSYFLTEDAWNKIEQHFATQTVPSACTISAG
jgi:hypothetical protein